MAEEYSVVKVVEDNLRQLAQETTEMLMEKITIIKKAVENNLSASPEMAKAPPGQTASLKDSILHIKKAANQSELTSSILQEAVKFSSRAAIFVTKQNRVQGWESIGTDSKNPDMIKDFRKVAIPLDESALFRGVIESQTPTLKLFESDNLSNYLTIQMGGRKPEKIFLAPLVLRDKVVAILFTDCLKEETEKFCPEFLGILAEFASLIMEIMSTGRVLGATEPVQKGEISHTAGAGMQTVEMGAEDAPGAEEKVQDSLETMDPKLKELHENAQRTARVIVSDIVLYNKAKIEEGLANGNLKELLKEEIERGKELYISKVAPEVVETTDYFVQTMIQNIAKGDPAVLGL